MISLSLGGTYQIVGESGKSVSFTFNGTRTNEYGGVELMVTIDQRMLTLGSLDDLLGEGFTRIERVCESNL